MLVDIDMNIDTIATELQLSSLANFLGRTSGVIDQSSRSLDTLLRAIHVMPSCCIFCMLNLQTFCLRYRTSLKSIGLMVWLSAKSFLVSLVQSEEIHRRPERH
ncbi:hypothetical protein DsansV1_C18g0153911 [Dioscorea sansibarensis]